MELSGAGGRRKTEGTYNASTQNNRGKKRDAKRKTIVIADGKLDE